MNPIINNRQTIITSWVLAALRWCTVGGYIYFTSRAAEYFDYKSGIGNYEKSESLIHTAGIFFWAWVSLILVAIILSLVSPKIERSMVILFQVVVLPFLELGFVFIVGLSSY